MTSSTMQALLLTSCSAKPSRGDTVTRVSPATAPPKYVPSLKQLAVVKGALFSTMP